MTRDDIIRLAQEAGAFFDGDCSVYDMPEHCFEKFAALVAAEKEAQMIRDGWRQCAEGQRTTQFCGLLEEAVKAEREECAKVCDRMADEYAFEPFQPDPLDFSDAIRARGSE